MQASGAEFGLSTIGQIAMSVRDLDAAVGFYRDTLGMKLLFTAPPGMAFFDCGGIRLMLGVPEGGEFERSASILYYRVGDIEAAHEELSGRGVRFEAPPHRVHRAADHDLWLAFFRDLEGNMLALMSEVARVDD